MEGQPATGKRITGADKVASELNLVDVGAICGAAVDLAEGHAFGHAERVAYIAQELALSLELDAESVADVTIAALFHDIGLLRITSELSSLLSGGETELLIGHPTDAVEDFSSLVRKGNLQQVSELIMRHSGEGMTILRELPLSDTVARLVEGHHERWDGHGYPAGHRGDGVPLEQRILTTADCIETVIARAGERGHSPDFVRSETMAFSGKQLDPTVGKQLAEVVKNVRFWGTFTGGQLAKNLASHIPQEKLEVTYADLALYFRRLVDLVDAKSPYRANHSWQMARISYLMALELGMADDLASSIGMAGLTHDLGKSGISNQILDKPKWLTGPEYEQAKNHIYYTNKILDNAGDLFTEVQGWVTHHHERLDGSGYPDRLKGDELSREVRILATADVYDALISDRPYRKGLDPVAAVRFMEGKVNRYFDPDVLAALGAVVDGSA
jgi:HD-GYP domain-containing protein (c-di-GMP phosphodiesterase class II)